MWLTWFDPTRRIGNNLLFYLPRVSPAAIQSWIRYGGSIYRSGLVRRGESYSKTSRDVNW